MKKNLAIILAGGTGSRIDGDLPKQFLTLAGKTILQHSIEKFEHHPGINHIFVVVNGEFINKTEEIVGKSGYQKVIKIIKGGETRQDSSRIGVTAAAGDYENVLIHDAARPLVSKKIITDILEALNRYSAVKDGKLCLAPKSGTQNCSTCARISSLGRTRSLGDFFFAPLPANLPGRCKEDPRAAWISRWLFLLISFWICFFLLQFGMISYIFTP